MDAVVSAWVGRSIERVEDAALLTGRGRYIDDLGARPGTLHAAILRSSHAHATIDAIDTAAARALPGVAAVITGADLADITATLVASVRAATDARPIATDRVRYVGEPVAVAIAADRYIAEDALDRIEVTYGALPAVVDPVAAAAPDAPVLHAGLGGNLVSERAFVYGDPDAAFASAAHRITVTTRYPRNTGAPMETYGVLAEYDPHEDAYDILANFQGPYSTHAVMSRALKVPGNRLRLRLPPDSGGSFGVKQGVAPYAVLIAACARRAGRPVKWIEDRLEHLAASVSATNRVTTLSAAIDSEGRILALDWDQLEDCGAWLRAPEPATLYRMHGNLTGAYAIRHVRVRNRVVLTNKTPTGLVRGFGGPQVYYPLERLMQRIAVTLGLDPLEVIRRNVIPTNAFPYRTATGALYDSGDYTRALAEAAHDGGLADLKRRRDEARAAGRLYGIGYTAVVEPSVSNMGYITTVLTAAERRRAGPKNGAQATATISLDPVGGVTVQVASAPQGQGHRTVLAQVVADVFGLTPATIPAASPPPSPAPRSSPPNACAKSSPASPRYNSTSPPPTSSSPPAVCIPPPTPMPACPSPASPPPATGPPAWSQTTSAPRSAKPYSGPRPNSPRRTTRTKSTPPSATASSSITAASKLIATPENSASINTSPCTIAAACCIPAWWTARSAAASPRRSAPPCWKNSPTLMTAPSSPAPSRTTCCPPPPKCPRRSSCTSKPSPPSPRSAPRG